MADFVANFDLSNNEIESDFDLENTEFNALLELNPVGASWGSITGNINNQTDLKEALDDKANVSAVEIIAENVNTITNTLDSYGDIVTYNASSFATSEQGSLADTALQPNDDISKLVNDVGYITDSALSDYATTTELTEGLAEKQDTISDLDTIRSNAENGASAYSTIQNYGDIVTHNASEFATSAQGSLADTALQPNDNISELVNDAGYITSSAIPTNYVTTDTTQSVTGTKDFTQINNVNSNNLATYNSIQLTNDIGNTSENLRLQGNGDRPKYRSGSNVTSYLALQSDIQTYTAGSGIDITSNAISVTSPVVTDNATGTHSIALGSSSQSTAEGSVAIGDTAKANSTYSTAIGYNAQATNTNSVVIGKQAKTAYPRTVAIGSGAEANANDALVIKGINNTANSFQVGSYTLLDTSTGLIPDARINSSTYATQSYVNNAVQTNSAHFRGNWTDWTDVPTNVNDYPADDDGNKTPTVNDYMVVQDASDYTLDTLEGTWQFTYTGTWADNGKAGWLPRFQVNETPLTQTQLDALNSGANTTNIGQIATNTNDISNINTTIGGYGDIVTYNASSFATSSQGAKADTALQSGDNISELNNNSGYITGITSNDVTTALGYTPYNSSNPSGYTSNVGTVTSVNNSSPDGNGNVNLTIPSYTDFVGADSVTGGASGLVPAPSAGDENKYLKGDGTWATVSGSGANVDLSNLSATGESHFLKNTATGTGSITVLGQATSSDYAVNIGYDTFNQSLYTTAIGYASSVGTSSNFSISIGCNANVGNNASYAIQIGNGTNLTSYSLNIGFGYDGNNNEINYQLLDGATGLIPDARLSTNIARTSQIPSTSGLEQTSNKVTSISSASTDTQYPSAKLLYDQLALKQATLVSGTSIKTINSTSVLGSGNFTLANQDLSNISATGKIVIDGAWSVSTSYKYVANAVTLNTNTSYNYDISSALPIDTYKYEVVISGWGYTATTSGNTANIYVTTDLSSSFSDAWMLAKTKTQAGNAGHWGGSATVIVGTGRKIYLKNTGTGKSTDVTVWISAYRRVGTNS